MNAVEETVTYAMQGVGQFLWTSDRALALTCVQALVTDAMERHSFMERQRRRPFTERDSEEPFHGDLPCAYVSSFHAAKLPMNFSVSPLEMILTERQMERWHETKEKVLAEVKKHRHRASFDAWIVQETYKRTLAESKA